MHSKHCLLNSKHTCAITILPCKAYSFDKCYSLLNRVRLIELRFGANEKCVRARARWREEKYVCAMCISLRISLLSIAWFTNVWIWVPVAQYSFRTKIGNKANRSMRVIFTVLTWIERKSTEWNETYQFRNMHSAHSADERTQRNTMQSPIDCVSRCVVILHLLFVDWITNSKLSEYSDWNESMHRLCPTRWTFSMPNSVNKWIVSTDLMGNTSILNSMGIILIVACASGRTPYAYSVQLR